MDFRKRTRKEQFTLSEESGQEQLAILLDYYEIYPDEFETQSEKEAYNAHVGNLLRAVRLGRLTISEEGSHGLTVIQNLKKGDVLEYGVLSGESKLEDRGAASREEPFEAQGTRRRYAILGALTGVGIAGIEKLKGPDLSTAESLGFLFSLV